MKHAELVRVVQNWLRTERRHGLVLAEPSTVGTVEEPDVIGWCAGVSTLVECKVSRADFLVDKKKAFRARPAEGMGRHRLYAAPAGLIKPKDLPERWGLLEVAEKGARRVTVVVASKAFTEWNLRGEVAFLASACVRALEGWGQKGFGDVAQTDKKHPRLERREARETRTRSQATETFNKLFPKIPRRAS